MSKIRVVEHGLSALVISLWFVCWAAAILELTRFS